MRDDTGVELDAEFSVERTGPGFDVILESRGGVMTASGKRRNTDYGPALILLLTRMAGLGLAIQQARIASATTEALTPNQRRLELRDHPYPVQLAGLTDFEALRLDLGRSLAAFRASADSQGKGTSAKRLRLSVVGSPLDGVTETVFARRLAGLPALANEVREIGRSFVEDGQVSGDDGGLPVWTEPPTADPDALAASVRALRRKLKGRSAPKAPPPGSSGGRQIIGQTVRYVRDPNVIVWVLEAANGRCEVCEQPAPFAREDGSPYLEVHHVRPLAEGGPDTVDNAVAACPNCHRALHYSSMSATLRASVLDRLQRIVDHPIKL
ncbi:MAG: HNH endonuclease signature motif containing protein [Brevundimonas sp.]|nr:HNH endonuclease signature motif containing protein [Brevundimonas sp.]